MSKVQKQDNEEMNSRYRKSKIKNLKHAKQDAKQNRG
jgi:hypothetical protein